MKTIYLGADHAGWERKEKIKEWLSVDGFLFEDLSGTWPDPEDDYPDVAFKVAEQVAEEDETLGILVCSSGIGMCIAANKMKGIRAATVYNVWMAEASRKDNNANVLCLPGRTLEDNEVKEIIKVWLNTNFSGENRHARRINKINNYL